MPLENKTLTTTGTTDVTWNGKLGALLASGTFDGATVKLQHKIGSNWVDLGPDVTLTSAGGGQFITPQSELRVDLSSHGGSTSVTVAVKPLVV